MRRAARGAHRRGALLLGSCPIVRCQEMSHSSPTMMLVEAGVTADSYQGTAVVRLVAAGPGTARVRGATVTLIGDLTSSGRLWDSSSTVPRRRSVKRRDNNGTELPTLEAKLVRRLSSLQKVTIDRVLRLLEVVGLEANGFQPGP